MAATAACSFSETTIQPGPTNGMDTYFGSVLNSMGVPNDQFIVCGGNISGDYYQSLIQFTDLMTGPVAANTSKAELWLYCASTNYDPNIQVFKVTMPWTEAGVNYSNYPMGIYYTYFAPVTSTGWHRVDITSLYREWKNNSATNYGMRLYPSNSSISNPSYFYSSNYIDDPTKRPKLVITSYTDSTTIIQPDLNISDVQTDAWSRTVSPGSSFNVTLTINNNGSLGVLSPYSIRIYFTYTRDTNLTTISTLPYVDLAGPTLGVNEINKYHTAAITVPSMLAQGFYYLVACIDYTVIIPESNETNNVTASNSTLPVGVEASTSQLDNAYAYPSPAYLSRGHKIKISGSLPNSYARVLTSSGQLIRTISPTNAGSGPEWDGKTDMGEMVSTGLYYIHVTDERNKTRIFTIFVYR